MYMYIQCTPVLISLLQGPSYMSTENHTSFLGTTSQRSKLPLGNESVKFVDTWLLHTCTYTCLLRFRSSATCTPHGRDASPSQVTPQHFDIDNNYNIIF